MAPRCSASVGYWPSPDSLSRCSARGWPLAIAGFAVFGLGTSNLIPLTFSAAGRAGGDGPAAATALARFTTFTYAGILFGPAAIGWVAQGIGLMWTLAVLIPILGAVAVSNRVTAAAA